MLDLFFMTSSLFDLFWSCRFPIICLSQLLSTFFYNMSTFLTIKPLFLLQTVAFSSSLPFLLPFSFLDITSRSLLWVRCLTYLLLILLFSLITCCVRIWIDWLFVSTLSQAVTNALNFDSRLSRILFIIVISETFSPVFELMGHILNLRCVTQCYHLMPSCSYEISSRTIYLNYSSAHELYWVDSTY